MSRMKDLLISRQEFDYSGYWLEELYADESYQEWLVKQEEEDLKYQIEHDDETIPF